MNTKIDEAATDKPTVARPEISINGKNGILDLFELKKNANALFEFLRFCAKEFSLENPLFLLAINDYRRNPSEGKYKFIFDKFLVKDAELEVNIRNASNALKAIQEAKASGKSDIFHITFYPVLTPQAPQHWKSKC
jgi:hypothetical protein